MSDNKTFMDWVFYYEKKSGSKFLYRPDCFLTIAPDMSFMQWKLVNDVFVAYETTGNSFAWRLFVLYLCINNKIKYAITYTHRSPKAYMRKLYANILREFDNDDGIHTYCLISEVEKWVPVLLQRKRIFQTQPKKRKSFMN